MPAAASWRYQRPVTRQISSTAVSGRTLRRKMETGTVAVEAEAEMLAPDWSAMSRRAVERGTAVNSTWARIGEGDE